MNILGSMFTTAKTNRPLRSMAEGFSANTAEAFMVHGRDHATGLTTFCLIFAIWVLTLLFV